MSRHKNPPKKKTRVKPVVTVYDSNDKPKATRVKAKTPNQQLYIDSINKNKITFCSGPAGTGKTKICVSLAIEALIDEKVDKIIITRPVMEVGNNRMGFLPGSTEEKLNPYLYPIYEELSHYVTKEQIAEYKAKDKIKIFPLAYMRGATLTDAFIIADECQNMSYDEIKMFLTRFGYGSRMVLNGDPHQSDLRSYERGSFIRCMDKLQNVEGIGAIRLTALDIVREPLVSKIVQALELDQENL